jgi:hypothetical protein
MNQEMKAVKAESDNRMGRMVVVGIMFSPGVLKGFLFHVFWVVFGWSMPKNHYIFNMDHPEAGPKADFSDTRQNW